MATPNNDGTTKWFIEQRPNYESLTNLVIGTLEILLRHAKVEFLSVSGRTKSVESFAEKCTRKNYANPQKDMTDLCGIRVIVYIEDDVKKACSVIRDSFKVHEDKSLDKASQLGVDRFGYRSFHFVCDLGKDRIKLPEYKSYKEMTFEIQVRTVLQHAWAEIEHDRNYKFSGSLPADIKRRLYTAAGALEMVDREFNAISKELEEYSEDVSERTEKGDLEIPIDAVSFTVYLKSKLAPYPRIDAFDFVSIEKSIHFFKKAGFEKISDLEMVFSAENLLLIENFTSGSNPFVTFYALLLWNLEEGSRLVFRKENSVITQNTVDLLMQKYDKKEIEDVVKKYHVIVDQGL